MSAAALQALAETALGLARSTTSGRLVLARLHGLVPAPLVPGALRPALAAAAEASREPVGPRAVERALRAAWGEAPGRVLDDLAREPAQVTPTAQLHRAALDGEPVAVWVQRPGLAELVRADLVALDALAVPLAAALPRLDARALLAEARERALDELDLEHQAQAQRTLARAVRDDPELHVPVPLTRLCHDEVLVAPWVDGTPLAALAGAPAEERARLARALVRLHVGALRAGLAHADPHPERVLRTPDGRLALTDLGATRPVAAHRADLAVAALDALADEDGAALGRALAAFGWLPEELGTEALELAWELLEPLLAGPSVLDVAAVLEAGERAAGRAEAVARLAARAGLPAEDLLPARMLGALALVLAPLAAELDWLAELRAAAAEGLARAPAA